MKNRDNNGIHKNILAQKLGALRYSFVANRPGYLWLLKPPDVLGRVSSNDKGPPNKKKTGRVVFSVSRTYKSQDYGLQERIDLAQ